MVVVIAPEVAANLRYRGLESAKLEPTYLSTGNYAVSEATKTDRRFAQYLGLLNTGTVTGSYTLADDAGRLRLTIDSKPVFLLSPYIDHAFSIPAPNLYRFESRHNEFGWDQDESHDNRHNELICDTVTFNSGETLWSSFSFVVGPEHAPFDHSDYVVTNVLHNTIHQWHDSGDSSPALAVEMMEGKLEIWTRSDAILTGPNNGAQVRYSATRPTDGVPHSLVLQGVLGLSGHLNAWLDGTQIIDVDCPIGFYLDGDPLCYCDWGIYCRNVNSTIIMYHGNIEWGTTDLSSRITNPLSMTAPAGDISLIYPDTTLYPDTLAYPKEGAWV